jgi:hypothetical protein
MAENDAAGCESFAAVERSMSDRLLNESNRDSAQDESEKSVKRPTLWSYARQMIDGAAISRCQS